MYAYGVHYRNEGDAYVGKDSFPKCGDSTGTEDEDKQLHSESQRDVLPDNPAGLPARMNGGGHSRRLVCLYHYIGGFDGGIAAKSAHGDAHMTKGKNRGIIDAVAHKGYSVGRVAAECLDVLHLSVRQQVSVCLGDA